MADQSRVVVNVLQTNGFVGSVTLALYAVTQDTWNESTVTFNTRPSQGVLLQSTLINAGFTGPVTFDDNAVGTFIQQQRSGDGIASFILRLDDGSGSLGFGGNILFEDREGTADGVNGNEPFIDVRPVSAGADLSISKIDNPDPVIVSDQLTYTITVTNNGPGLATNVVLTDMLPSGVNFFSASASQGVCGVPLGNSLTCALGNLANGVSVDVTIMVTSMIAGILVNNVNVGSATADPITGNNSGSEQTMVNPLPQADLAVSKVDADDPVMVGDPISYTVTVSNTGSTLAANVVLTDTLPGRVNFVSAVTNQGSCNEMASLVICSLGNLSNGVSANITIVASSIITGTITNHASVSSDTVDPVPANNHAQEQTTIVVEKSDDTYFIYLPLILKLP